MSQNWTSCGSDAFAHTWSEKNYPEELALAIANATPKTKKVIDDCWTGNTYADNYEEITITVQDKTFTLHRNYVRSHEGYWKPHARWS